MVRIFVDAPVEKGLNLVQDDAVADVYSAALGTEVQLAPEWRRGVDLCNSSLNAATDKKDWWEKHRPLLAQTAALGPIDQMQRIIPDQHGISGRPNASFQGLRHIKVQANKISGMKYVGAAQMRAYLGATAVTGGNP